MGHACPAFDVKDFHTGVGEGFPEDELGIGPDGGFNLRVGGIGLEEGDADAQFGEGDAQQVEGAAVDVVGGDDVVSGAGYVDDGKEVGGLAGRGEDGTHAAFQGIDLGGCLVHRGVLEAGIEVAGFLQVEQAGHLVGGLVFEGGALDDGNLPGLAFPGLVACVDAEGVKFCHIESLFLNNSINSLCFFLVNFPQKQSIKNINH